MIRIESPVGTVTIEADGGMCRFMKLGDVGWTFLTGELPTRSEEERLATEATEALTAKELEEYFRWERREFSVKPKLEGTEFQRMVWEEICRIPYGETISYAELARRIGRPKAVRAVANACRCNKVWILVPCHRVIGSDGSLTGYAGGLPIKRMLLNLESSNSGKKL